MSIFELELHLLKQSLLPWESYHKKQAPKWTMASFFTSKTFKKERPDVHFSVEIQHFDQIEKKFHPKATTGEEVWSRKPKLLLDPLSPY